MLCRTEVSILGKIIAIYMRLSIADDEVVQDESNSIKAQRDLIYQYINEKKNLMIMKLKNSVTTVIPVLTLTDQA